MVAREARQLPVTLRRRANRLVGTGNRERWPAVIVDLNHNGAIKTRGFKPGLNLGPRPRFDAGVASTKVPVAPVTARCPRRRRNDMVIGHIDWQSTDAADISITTSELCRRVAMAR